MGESGMLIGNYYHTLDEKSRLIIPSKFRGDLGNKIYILKGFDGALSLYKEEAFQKLVQNLSTLSFNKKDDRAYIRIELANACELEIDKNGRVLLPTALLSKYNIGKEVVVIGVLDHIEIWNKQDFEDYEKNANDKFEDIAENITKGEN